MLAEPWRISLFGGLEARQGERVLTRFQTHKTALLLAYLAYHLHRPHPREELLELLWPEDDLDAARNRLRVALASLRRQLEPPGVLSGSVLAADRFAVRLNPPAVTTDVAAFEEALREAETVGARQAVSLQRAVECYRGDLLPGYYAEWVTRERERLALAYQKALRQLVRALATARDFDRALDYANRLVRADPLHEESHRNLMRLYAALGQPEAARRQYGELERLLREELGAAPSAATRELAERLRGQRIEPQRHRDTEVSPRKIESPTSNTERLNARTPEHLLLLDNFEHLLEGGEPIVQALLEHVPSLICLVTSRRSLGLEGEREFPVRPLPVPDSEPQRRRNTEDSQSKPESSPLVTSSPLHLLTNASVQLFVDRAQAVRPDFQVTARNADAVAALCERLEGLPLSIELAAARAGVMTLSQLLERLDRRLDLLVNRRAGKDLRHRSLHAAIEWSYRLLPPPLRLLFARLSIFQGGWTLEAAEAVCGVQMFGRSGAQVPNALDGLEHLRECSLVLAEEGASGMRFRLLESIREFASEQLKHAERTALARRHAEHFLMLAEEAQPHLNGPGAVGWLHRLDEERDNLRSALAGAIARGEGETALRIIVALGTFWERRGHLTEARVYLRQALPLDGAPPLLRSRALCMAGIYAREQGDPAEAEALFSESLALAEQEGDSSCLAEALYGLGIAAHVRRDFARSRSLIERSLALRRCLGDRRGIAHALNILGLLAWRADQNQERARTLYEEAQSHLAEIGDRRSLSVVWNNLGILAHETGNLEEAALFFQSCQRIYQEIGDYRSQSVVWNNLGVLAQKRREFAAAMAAYHESLQFSHAILDRKLLSDALWNLASTCHDMGNHARAARLLAASERLWEAFSPLNAEEQALHDRITGAARDALGGAVFSAAWAEGRAMSLEEAVRYGLDTACPRPDN